MIAVKLCACGCGNYLSDIRSKKYNYLPYHAKTPPEKRMCACGCGNAITGKRCGSRYLIGHHRQAKMRTFNCAECGKPTTVKAFRKDRFCSRDCSGKFVARTRHTRRFPDRGIPRGNKLCFTCSKPITKYPHELKERTRQFCSRECYRVYRSKLRMTTTPRSANSQRAMVLASRKHQCERCGYDRVPAILQIHHENEQPLDGGDENMKLLCPNCHEEIHFARKTGRYIPHKRQHHH